MASTTPQMWLVAGSHLGFAKKIFSLHRNDKIRMASFLAMTRFAGKNRVASVQTICHGERPCASWPSVSKQIASVVSLHRNDKVRGQEPGARTARQVR
jgi:hypothetical protein